MEIYLLSLIFQYASPKQALDKARDVLTGVPLSTPSLEKVLQHLERYEQKESIFSPKDFVSFIPSELHIPFDTSYLSTITEFPDDSHFMDEIEKTAKQIKSHAVHKKLAKIAEMLKDAEIRHDESKVREYELEFDKFSRLLPKS